MSTVSLSLPGRVCLVTGGTRGIGLACAHLLAAAGANLVVVGRKDEMRARQAAQRISADFDVPALGLVADATRPDEVRQVYQEVRREYGRLDVLVNNAGVLKDALVGMIDDATLSETLDTNVAGPIHHLQSAARLIGRSGGGSIINMASIIGRVGNSGQIAYGASKAAMIGLTLSAAKELAPKGIRVNAVAPGFIDTDMTRALPDDMFRQRVHSIAMGRVGTADDVARVVLFLASDFSAYVTGQVIGVDGGMLI